MNAIKTILTTSNRFALYCKHTEEYNAALFWLWPLGNEVPVAPSFNDVSTNFLKYSCPSYSNGLLLLTKPLTKLLIKNEETKV